MHPLFDLSSKVALITGASRGIGEAIARAYADAGASLVLGSRKADSIEAVARSIRESGGTAFAVQAHCGRGEEVERLIATACEEFEGIDILVNNAATSPHFGPVLTADEGAWDKTSEVNLKGYFFAARAVAEPMARRGGGKILNIASVSALRPLPGLGVYSVTKAAVTTLTRVLAAELASRNIQVNALAPGLIKTRFSRALWGNEDYARQALERIPAGRIGEVEDLIGAALYFAARASDYTTGAVLVVDGGYSIS